MALPGLLFALCSICASRFLLLVAPHEDPKSVRCCVNPTRPVLGGARKGKGPRRVLVEKEREAGEREAGEREAGEREEKVRVRGLA